MVCISPADFKVPKTAELPLDVPLEIGFSREGEQVPYTNSDIKFRFYADPKVTAMIPPGCHPRDVVTVNLEAKGKNNFYQAITGFTTSGDVDMTHTIVCQFGDYGVTPATYVDKNTITCLSPVSGWQEGDPDDIPIEYIPVKISMNGQDFYDAGTFSFFGC